jgi:hypothetical protein
MNPIAHADGYDASWLIGQPVPVVAALACDVVMVAEHPV